MWNVPRGPSTSTPPPWNLPVERAPEGKEQMWKRDGTLPGSGGPRGGEGRRAVGPAPRGPAHPRIYRRHCPDLLHPGAVPADPLRDRTERQHLHALLPRLHDRAAGAGEGIRRHRRDGLSGKDRLSPLPERAGAVAEVCGGVHPRGRCEHALGDGGVPGQWVHRAVNGGPHAGYW